jgi:endo-1,4-beta-D-glucanase Y
MIMSWRTDPAAETGRRMTLTAGPRCRRALTASWLISMLLGGTLQTTSAHETAMPDPHAGTSGANWVIDAWRAYAAKFTTPDGRVIDDANGGISHSEGQGYAMLIALRAGDRAGFDRLWKWTSANLEVRGDHLAAWRWDPAHEPHVADQNNATDGDLLIAWALAEAGAKWNVPAYTEAARDIADAVGMRAAIPSRFGPLLLPGTQGFGPGDRADGPVVNLSYWIFPALDRLGSISHSADWSGVAQSGLSLIDAARFGSSRLPSNWITLAGKSPAPAHGFPAVFGYDAVRIPLYLAWGRPDDVKRLAMFSAVLAHGHRAPAVTDVASGTAVEPFGGDGFRAIAGLVDCVVRGSKMPRDLLQIRAESYYSTSLHILALIAAQDVRPACMNAPVASRSP